MNATLERARRCRERAEELRARTTAENGKAYEILAREYENLAEKLDPTPAEAIDELCADRTKRPLSVAQRFPNLATPSRSPLKN